jgi:hypothetical protein
MLSSHEMAILEREENRRRFANNRYWSLVVKRRDGELMRTAFQYGRVLPDIVAVAREHGWTPVAYVGVLGKNLPKKRERGLIPL